MQAKEHLEKFIGNTLVLSGDVPLIKSSTLTNLIEQHEYNHSKGSLISAILKDPFGYGRILRNENLDFIKMKV